MVLSFPISNDDRIEESGYLELFTDGIEVALKAGKITQEEAVSITLNSYFRSRPEVFKVLEQSKSIFRLEAFEIYKGCHPAYHRLMNQEISAIEYAKIVNNFGRAPSEPAFISCLNRPKEESTQIIREIFDYTQKRIEEKPISCEGSVIFLSLTRI